MHGFNFIEHTADIAVEVWGDSYEELFLASAESFVQCLSNEAIHINTVSQSISLTSRTPEELLVEYLNELNFLVETKNLIYIGAEQIVISEKENFFELSASVKLNKLDRDTDLKNEIKAITYHQMEIEFKGNSYTTRIVFDI